MVQRVSTVAFEGIEARAVDVQVQVAPGLVLAPLNLHTCRPIISSIRVDTCQRLSMKCHDQ